MNECIINGNSRDCLLQFDDFGRCHHRHELVERIRVLAIAENSLFVNWRRITDTQSQHETIELRLRQRICAVMLDGILCCQNYERSRQIVCDTFSRYMSLGYWRDPDRTRAAFLPDPDGGDARIYLTGDLGRRTPDGILLHVGRKDSQAKIRGFRVDVVEIENTLRTIAGVRDAVVVPREIAPGEPRLVAYYTATTNAAMPVSALRAALAQALPDYMIPSAFVALDAIPITPNGKTDRVRLPPPVWERPRRDVDPADAGSAVETALASMWASVLGLDRVGLDDDFFELGGDSLQAARIAARATAAWKLSIPARALLEAPTVSAMAKTVASALVRSGRDEDEPPRVSLAVS